jgi:GDPmannose 4,6-dehydratase
MMWLMLQQDTPDDYVIATGETHSVREWLEAVFNEASLPIDENVGIDHRLFRPHEVPLLLGDPSKAKEKLGWVPKMKFKQLAKLMYQEDRVEAERELRALGRDVKVQALIDGQKMPFREPKK